MDSNQPKKPETVTGPLAWMVRNRITPNLLMLIFIIGGLLLSSQIKREVLPAFDLDQIIISVNYPGASPEEVEQGILLAIEQSLGGMEAIEKITAVATEGSGRVVVELREKVNARKAFQDIDTEIGRISTFPKDAEKAVVSLDALKWRVLRLHLYGDMPYHQLRLAAEKIKAELLRTEGISQVEMVSPRNHEIEVAVPVATLRRYNLSHEQIAAAIRTASVELPGGSVDSEQGEILLRLKNRSKTVEEFAAIPIITTATGGTVSLGQIADIAESFDDVLRSTSFNGKPSIELLISRVGKETPISVSEKTREKMATIIGNFSPALNWAITNDNSEMYRARLGLLLKNAFIGLLLVLILLGLFLEVRLAFWVTMGIPVSFLGTMLFLPFFDVSINMVSMFAFIVALGIVVDDAIIAGENIHKHRQQGMSALDAAIIGAREVAIPITFSILTNIVAFLPLAFVPGIIGKMWRVIPLVVITAFAISWFESVFILPAHLAQLKKRKNNAVTRWLENLRLLVNNLMYRLTYKRYLPLLHFVLSCRYLFILVMLSVLLVSLCYVTSGRVPITPIPRVESDRVQVTATLPWGCPDSRLYTVREKLLATLAKVDSKYKKGTLIANTSTFINNNVVRIRAELTPIGIRPIGAAAVARLWRETTGSIVGLQSLLFEADARGPGSGAAISIELDHQNISTLNAASASLARQLEKFAQTRDIDQGHTTGKPQYSYTINKQGLALGLNSTSLGRQIRGNWQGIIALRQQQGENEVTVRVRLPENERANERNLEEMLIKTPNGGWVPLAEITTVTRTSADTSITRQNRRRTITVKANVVPLQDTRLIIAALKKSILPQLEQQFPGLHWSFQGRQVNSQKSVASLATGFLFALGGIYILLAIPFGSYSQPLIVMSAIPFGIIGAIYGHMLLGYSLSLASMMGMVALSGVVVNDSLILVHYANQRKGEGENIKKAVIFAGTQRFRPVLLTTLTTFCGLTPMIFETSRQAKFIIPMAISLGFGIIFATTITLLLIPSFYLAIHDLYTLATRQKRPASRKGTKTASKKELDREKLEEFILGIGRQEEE